MLVFVISGINELTKKESLKRMEECDVAVIKSEGGFKILKIRSKTPVMYDEVVRPLESLYDFIETLKLKEN